MATVAEVARSRSGARTGALFAVAAAAVVVGTTLLFFLIPEVLAARLVKSVSVDVSPAVTAHCPAASWTFTGHIQVRGDGGPIAYQWIKPDGQTDDVVETRAVGGSVTPVTLQFNVNGNSRFTGSAQLHILRPAGLLSAPATVTMECP